MTRVRACRRFVGQPKLAARTERLSLVVVDGRLARGCDPIKTGVEIACEL